MGDEELEKALDKIFKDLRYDDYCKIDVEFGNNKADKMNYTGKVSTIVATCLTIIKEIYDDGGIRFDKLLTGFTYIFKDEVKDLDLGEENDDE